MPPVNTALATSFIPFGATLGPGRENPAYEIVTSDTAAPVLSPTAGTIGWVRLNPNFPDYELQIIPEKGKAFRIYIDHLYDVRVAEGATVGAGDTLGRVGAGARTELQINNEGTGKAVCPRTYGTAAFNTAMDTAMARTNRMRVEPYAGVCLKEEVVP